MKCLFLFNTSRLTGDRSFLPSRFRKNSGNRHQISSQKIGLSTSEWQGRTLTENRQSWVLCHIKLDNPHLDDFLAEYQHYYYLETFHCVHKKNTYGSLLWTESRYAFFWWSPWKLSPQRRTYLGAKLLMWSDYQKIEMISMNQICNNSPTTIKKNRIEYHLQWMNFKHKHL